MSVRRNFRYYSVFFYLLDWLSSAFCSAVFWSYICLWKLFINLMMGLLSAVCNVLLFVIACEFLTYASAVGERKRLRPPLVEEEGRRKLQKQTRKWDYFCLEFCFPASAPRGFCFIKLSSAHTIQLKSCTRNN